jgi:hypothetical protein
MAAIQFHAETRRTRRRMCLNWQAMAATVAIRYLLGLLFVSSISAQTKRFGSLEVTQPDSNEIQLSQGGKEWHIDVTHLLRVNDCYDERICTGPPKSPCPACPRMVDVIAWDQHRQKLYFVIGSGGWQARPWIVFNYNLVTHAVTRFSSTFATVIRDGEVSPSGQYLAYIQVFHCSPGMQGRCPSDAIEVMDLWDQRVAHRPYDLTPNHDVIRIRHLTWSSPSIVNYSGSVESFTPEPQPERPTKGSLDVRTLEFH